MSPYTLFVPPPKWERERVRERVSKHIDGRTAFDHGAIQGNERVLEGCESKYYSPSRNHRAGNDCRRVGVEHDVHTYIHIYLMMTVESVRRVKENTRRTHEHGKHFREWVVFSLSTKSVHREEEIITQIVTRYSFHDLIVTLWLSRDTRGLIVEIKQYWLPKVYYIYSWNRWKKKERNEVYFVPSTYGAHYRNVVSFIQDTLARLPEGRGGEKEKWIVKSVSYRVARVSIVVKSINAAVVNYEKIRDRIMDYFILPEFLHLLVYAYVHLHDWIFMKSAIERILYTLCIEWNRPCLLFTQWRRDDDSLTHRSE